MATVPCRRRDTCRLCGGEDLSLVLALTPTPPANAFVEEAAKNTEQSCFPLDVYFCGDCAHIQLLDVVDPGLLFKNYVYVSGTSPIFIEHFDGYANDVIERFTIDGNAGMRLDAHQLHQIGQGGGDIDGEDIGARHHHVARGQISEIEDVAQQDKLVTPGGFAGILLFDQLLDGIAQRGGTVS